MQTMRDRLAQVMAQQGIKQADLVRRSGISKSVISLLLSDPGRDLLASNLILLAKTLNVDPLWLYSGKESTQFSLDLYEDVNRVPVFTLEQLTKNSIDRAPIMEADEYLHSERYGKLVGIKAANNALKESGVAAGDVCIFDLATITPQDRDIVLAHLNSSGTDQLHLLKVVPNLFGMFLAVDDPRIGAIGLEDARIYGIMLEVRKTSR